MHLPYQWRAQSCAAVFCCVDLVHLEEGLEDTVPILSGMPQRIETRRWLFQLLRQKPPEPPGRLY